MAGLRGHKREPASNAPGEMMPDMIEDFDELDGDAGDDEGEEQSQKVRFAKSTDVRRRIEERLEVRLLRDELGMDDLDIDD